MVRRRCSIRRANRKVCAARNIATPAGQAQKELFVNEAHALVDLLLHPAFETESDTPPADPDEGQCWLVGSNPTGAWTSRAGNLAGWTSGTWIFSAPQEGMRALAKSSKQVIFFSNGWQRVVARAIASGGQVTDIEARAAIEDLIATLRSAGILPAF